MTTVANDLIDFEIENLLQDLAAFPTAFFASLKARDHEPFDLSSDYVFNVFDELATSDVPEQMDVLVAILNGWEAQAFSLQANVDILSCGYLYILPSHRDVYTALTRKIRDHLQDLYPDEVDGILQGLE